MFATMLYKVITRFVNDKDKLHIWQYDCNKCCYCDSNERADQIEAENVKLLGNSWHNSIKGSSRKLQHTKWSLK
jgi:hypothetical protein